MYEITSGQSIRWWPQPLSDAEGNAQEYDQVAGVVDEDGESTRHSRLVPAVWLVWTRNQARRNQWLYYARQYGGIEQVTATPLGLDPAAQIFEPASLPYNIIRSGTNTLTAKVGKNRTIPTYLPVGGDHRIHKRCKLLNRFVAGLFHKHKVHKHTYRLIRDASLYGSGLMLIEADGKNLRLDNLFPWEVFVDPVDARDGDPRSLYLVRYADKDKLKMRFPSHAEAIETAPVLDESFFPIQDVFAVATRCTMIEAWHLPSAPGAKDGRHTVCLLDETLLDEPYEEDEYPIVHLQKDIPLAGWWGIGLGDGMSGFQDETSAMAERVSYAHRIVAGQVIYVPDGGGILDTDFNDEIGVVVRYQGGPAMKPEVENPQPLHPATYEYFKDLPPTAFGFEGISTMSAQAQRPPGVTAALALQTIDDMETDRFIMFERGCEEAHVDVSRLMLKAVRRIYKKFGDFEVFTAVRGSGHKIKWSDVDLEEDSYVVQAWGTSLLPKTPAARLQKVIELSTNGVFDRAQTLKLMEMPDTTAEERLILAPREAAEAQIAHMLECDCPQNQAVGYIPPSKFQDLSYAMSRAQQEYNLLQADALDQGTLYDPMVIARLNNLARYAKACMDELKDAQQQAAMQQALAQAQMQTMPAGQAGAMMPQPTKALPGPAQAPTVGQPG